jgi:hypothetical protein
LSTWSFAFGQPALYGFADSVEDFNDIVVILCTALDKWNSVFVGKCSPFLNGYLTVSLLAIGFVADNHLAHGLWLRFVDLLDPILEVNK